MKTETKEIYAFEIKHGDLWCGRRVTTVQDRVVLGAPKVAIDLDHSLGTTYLPPMMRVDVTRPVAGGAVDDSPITQANVGYRDTELSPQEAEAFLRILASGEAKIKIEFDKPRLKIDVKGG